MNDYADYDYDFFTAVGTIVGVIIIIAICVGVYNKGKTEETQQTMNQTVDQRNVKSNLIMDSSILESRTFVKEFDDKVEIATTESKMCFEGNKSAESIDRCMIMMYDKHKLSYRFENGMVRIDRNLYELNLKNASKKLSTEI